MNATRLHLYLGKNQHRVRKEAKLRGVSMSQLTQAALIAFLDADKDKREALVLRRFDRLSRQMGKLERDFSILTETLALFIQYELAIAPPIPVSDQAAAKALAKERFAHFIKRVASRLETGKSLTNEVIEEFSASETDFFNLDLGNKDSQTKDPQNMGAEDGA